MTGYVERKTLIDNSWYSSKEECRVISVDFVNSIPTADVRPVVLCLHCKNWDTSWAPNCGKEYRHFCPMVGTVTDAGWFCADGEMKEEHNG